MHDLAALCEQRRDGWLGEPLDPQAGDLPAQLACDGDIPPRVAKPDWGADKQRARRVMSPDVGLLRRHALPREIGDQTVHEDRMPGVGYVSLSLQLHHASAGELRGQKAALEHLALVAVAMHHKDRTPDLAADRLHLLPRARDRIVLIH